MASEHTVAGNVVDDLISISVAPSWDTPGVVDVNNQLAVAPAA